MKSQEESRSRMPAVEGAESAGAAPQTTTIQAWLIWGAAATFYLFEFFVRVAPSTMEPELQRTFHLTAGGLGGALGVYYYIYAPLQLVVGGLLDRFGARMILIPAAILCSLGCLVELAGTSPAFLIGGRFMQGFGSAFAFVGAMFLVTRWFPARRLALLSGLTTALGMLGAIAANAGIAEVVQTMGWQIALRDAAFVGLGVAVLLFFVIPRKHANKPAEAEGVAAAEAQKPGVVQALKIVFSNPQTWLVGLIGTALYMPLSVLGALWGVEYIVQVTGETKVSASGAVSMLYVGWMFGGPAAGWFSDRLGRRRLFLLAASVLTLLTTLLLLVFSTITIGSMYALMLGIGLVSSAQIVSFVSAVEHNPRNVSGTAIAATNMLIMLLGGLAQPLVGVLLDAVSGPSDTGVYSSMAYRVAMSVIPLSAAVGLVAAFFLRESYLADPAEPRDIAETDVLG